MKWYTYLIEILVLAFIVAAYAFMSVQSNVTPEAQEKSADSASNVLFDKLNSSFDEDTTVVLDTTSSTAPSN
jgi:hypothetical protein